MTNYRRGLWLYPLFQIPLMFLGLFSTMALLFWLFGFGRPSVAVAIAIDLSSSTYGTEFNEPGSIMSQEIAAVQAYLNKNNSGILRQPNEIKIFGFASGVQSLTNNFNSDSQVISQQLNNAIKPELANMIGGGTNFDLAISESTNALATMTKKCRELLIVTDGEAMISPEVITQTISQKVSINAIVIGAEAPIIQAATFTTGGKYISADLNNLESLFTEKFFDSFNNNWRWILLWLGLAWIALMFSLIMPLDRWIFQGLFKIPINLAGRLALCNALFWTAATPGILWRIYQIFNLSLPFIKNC
jgi:Ca-activated chloride channel family protein